MTSGNFRICAVAVIALAGCSSPGENGAADNGIEAPASVEGNAQAAPANAAELVVAGPAGWKLPMAVSALSKKDRDAILKAAGYTLHKGEWNAWDDFSADYSGPAEGCPAGIPDKQFDGRSSIRDLNGDGNPEVIVNSSGSFCYGNTGEEFRILTWTQNGWRKLIEETGIPRFYPHKGSAWPDIEIGGPGFCFGRARWSGHDYSGDGGRSYDNKPCGKGIVGDDPTGAGAKVGGPPVPYGKYALNESCADAALSGDYLVLSSKYWGEIDGDTPIGPFKDLGGNRWSLGSGLTIKVTGPKSFAEGGRTMTWCSP